MSTLPSECDLQEMKLDGLMADVPSAFPFGTVRLPTDTGLDRLAMILFSRPFSNFRLAMNRKGGHILQQKVLKHP
jgi:hypothetical protein